MRTKKVKRIKFLKSEKIMFFLSIIIVGIIMPAFFVYTKATLSKTNINLEQIKTKIANQEDNNQALNMQIDELASLDNIQNIANSIGLSYNNSNIKTINE